MNTTAIDTETSLIMPGVKAPPLVCVTAASHDGSWIAHRSDPDLVPTLLGCFETQRVVMANAPFDIGVLTRFEPALWPNVIRAYEDDRVVDVQMTERLNDLQNGTYRFREDEEGNFHRKSYSLDAISKRRLGMRKQFDKYRLRFHDYFDLPAGEEIPDEPARYAIVDAELTYKLDRDQPQHGDQGHQARGHLALDAISARGIRTDNNRVVKLWEQCHEWAGKIEPALRDAGLLRGDGTRNVKAAVRRMIDTTPPEALVITQSGEDRLLESGNDLEKFVKDARSKGKWVSVSTEACIQSGDPVLRQYGVYAKLNSMMKGTIKDLEKGTYLPIQTYFDPLMETGRTSSAGPNIQNQRRGIELPHPFDLKEKLKFKPDPRGCFRAREGMLLLACDIGGAENHTLAQVCYSKFGFSDMADALNHGRDLHLWVASFIMGVTYEEIDARYAQGDPDAKNARQLAKICNFGFPGGCGAARFVSFAKMYGVDIDFHTAQSLKLTWYRAYREIPLFFDYVAGCVADSGWHYVEHLFSKRVRGRASYTAACNSHFQGLAADAMKAVLWEILKRQVCRELGSALFGTYMVNFIHDEVILECPLGREEAVSFELRNVVRDTFNRYVPDVPASCGVEGMVYWTKAGVPLIGENDEWNPKGWDPEQAWEEAA